MSGKEHYDYSGNPMSVDQKGHVTRGDQRFDGADVPRTGHHNRHDGLDEPHVGGVGTSGDNEHKLRETMRDNDTSSERVRNDAHEHRSGVKGLVDKLTGK